MNALNRTRPGRLAPATLMIALAITSLWNSLPESAEASGRSRGDLDRVCDSAGRIEAATLPASVDRSDCDLVGRTVVSGDVSLEVPRPGHGVSGAALASDGESELFISTSKSGVVRIFESGHGSNATSAGESLLLGPVTPEPCDENAVPGCLPPCETNSNAVNPVNARVRRGQPWKFKASSTPKSLTTAFALAEIKAGTKVILNSTNSCGLSDVVAKTSPYKGTASAGSGISTNGSTITCPSSNGKNIVDFGALPGNVLGYACTRTTKIGSRPWFIVEADIRFKASGPWSTAIDSDECLNEFDLRGVAAHERGHAFGVSHANPDVANSQLTMWPSMFPCNSYARTLGKGDHTALNKLY